jgi:hypothetical protein
MSSELVIRLLSAGDESAISDAFAAVGWQKPVTTFERYLVEQLRGERTAYLALVGGHVAGYVTVRWRSGYAPFADAGVPEVSDFNVLPASDLWTADEKR